MLSIPFIQSLHWLVVFTFFAAFAQKEISKPKFIDPSLMDVTIKPGDDFMSRLPRIVCARPDVNGHYISCMCKLSQTPKKSKRRL